MHFEFHMWLRTSQIMKEETHYYHFMGYSFIKTVGIFYMHLWPFCGTLVGTENCSMGPPGEIDPTNRHTLSYVPLSFLLQIITVAHRQPSISDYQLTPQSYSTTPALPSTFYLYIQGKNSQASNFIVRHLFASTFSNKLFKTNVA